MLGKLLCFFGLHKIDQEPMSKELLRSEGSDVLFWTRAIQKGLSRCTRRDCNFHTKVYRTGLCGAGGSAGKWKQLFADKEKYIDSLPVL
ncbi:hypothetical protein IPM19_00885 [bacterium]|nr:MAG: hypothetical protein IPM19_00885 [bacterium]